MNPIATFWFWLLILSIICFILALIFYEIYGETSNLNTSTPWWVWLLFFLGLILWIVALILYALYMDKCKRELAMAIACGEYVPPKEPVVVCTKDECMPKVVKEDC